MVLCKTNQCTGCSACANACPHQCIQMISDDEGFIRPSIDEDLCINCGICQLACPILSPLSSTHNTTAYAAINPNEDVRLQSTSGGIFSLLAQWTFDHNGVVFGAAYTENYSVAHQSVTDMNGLSKLRTAKYAQSWVGDSFQQAKTYLDENRYVLFSGTPCQIGGLSNYLGRQYNNLIMVDLICHGVPSPSVWSKYIEYRKNKESHGASPISINLRSKETGWPGYSIRFDYPNGFSYIAKNSEDPYLRCFIGDLCLRPSCYDCHFKGISRISDFTLGDYWGVWSQLPESSEYNDRKGTSLVLIHSEQAKKIWADLQNQLHCQQVALPKCLEENLSAVKSSALPDQRIEFMNCYLREDFADLVQRLLPKGKSNTIIPSILSRFKNKLVQLLYK